MKTLLLFSILFLTTTASFCTQINVELVTKDNDNLDFLTSIEIMDSFGKRIAFDKNQSESLSIDFTNSINEKIKIKINAMGYFPVEINYHLKTSTDSISITNMLLVPSLRRELPKNATCGTWAPRKKDIPKKIIILINGVERTLVPDNDDVLGITYIEK
ncbi:hypothetical protein [Mangrovimonas sp. TPBH4]|uniref:hypothetical protein n=1 Tax=Mangrovimonas sp. TPBH4 TaxID=1645914 RepID=UPI0006B69604|nr:hypothetical protein [Mangrovimonas sp. TPBH4]